MTKQRVRAVFHDDDTVRMEPAPTLLEACLGRIEEYRKEREAEKRFATKVHVFKPEEWGAVITNIENLFREWVHDELGITLPDDVRVEIDPNFREQAVSGQPFPVTVHLRPGLYGPHPSVTLKYFRYDFHVNELEPSLDRHMARPHLGFEKHYTDFLDAVIYAVGGEKAFEPHLKRAQEEEGGAIF